MQNELVEAAVNFCKNVEVDIDRDEIRRELGQTGGAVYLEIYSLLLGFFNPTTYRGQATPPENAQQLVSSLALGYTIGRLQEKGLIDGSTVLNLGQRDTVSEATNAMLQILFLELKDR